MNKNESRHRGKQVVSQPKFKRYDKVVVNSLFEKNAERVINTCYHNGTTFMYFFSGFKTPCPEKYISLLKTETTNGKDI